MVTIPKSALTPQQRYYESVKDDPEYRLRNRQRSQKYREQKRADRAADDAAQKAAEAKKKKAKRKRKLSAKKKEKRRNRDESTEGGGDGSTEETDLFKLDAVESDTQYPLDSLTLRRDNPHPPPTHCVDNAAQRELFKVRRFLRNWTSEWGPVACWPTFIMTELKESVLTGKEKDWRGDMTGKSEQGKVMVGQLRGMFKVLPQDPWMVRDFWCQAFDLLEQIQAGIACLQAHMDYELEM